MINKKIALDTLEYATLLKEKGVANPEAHAASLATVIVQNLYTKDEVDKMIEATFQRFDKRFEDFSRSMDKQWEERNRDMNRHWEARHRDMSVQWEERTRDMNSQWEERTRAIEVNGRAMIERIDERTRGLEKELHQLDKNIQSTGSRTIFMTVSILGALIAVVGAAATFTHFVH